jgi:hypothetical protein
MTAAEFLIHHGIECDLVRDGGRWHVTLNREVRFELWETRKPNAAVILAALIKGIDSPGNDECATCNSQCNKITKRLRFFFTEDELEEMRSICS